MQPSSYEDGQGLVEWALIIVLMIIIVIVVVSLLGPAITITWNDFWGSVRNLTPTP